MPLMTDPNGAMEFQSQSRKVIESFLQSVVVLDDRAEMPRSEKPPIAKDSDGTLTSPDYPQSTTPIDSETTRDPTGVPLDAESVIDGFAEIGSVCAVLKANPNDSFRRRTVRAARRADIIILDWRINDSTGDEALNVLREILQGDEGTERLRMIAIYTGEPDLEKIYERVRNAIVELYPSEGIRERGVLRMSLGPLHVVILAKSGVDTANKGEHQQQVVTEGELAGRLADEYGALTCGLVRNTAIAGISGIRSNAHKILAKFGPDLDSAYLGHRILLHDPADAEDHIEEALSSEIASVLEDHRPGRLADGHAINSWLTKREAEGLNLCEPLGSPGGQNPVSGWSSLLNLGFEAPGLPFPDSLSKNALRRQAAEPFAEDSDAAKQSNRSFAALLTLKTRYPSRPPCLSVGSVLCVRDGDQRSYSLCLQPECDSVRLRGPTGFPFIPLVPLAGAGDVRDGVPLRLVCRLWDGQWMHFGIVLKPSSLTVQNFAPNSGQRGEVCACKDHDGRYYFEDSKGKRHCWIAELKPAHAMQITGELSSVFSRPGPNDSEWLRRAFGSLLEQESGGD